MPFGARAKREAIQSYLNKLKQAEFLPPGHGGGTVRKLGYQPALEGLRAILLFLVILAHSQQYLIGKVIAIPIEGLSVMSIFFLLSGFLVTSIIVKNLQQTGSVQYRPFFWRRIKRLYAPVILFVVVYLIVNIAIGDPLLTRPGSKILGVAESAALMLTSTINLAPTFGYSERFDSVQMWSLGVDMQLYLILPLFIFILFRTTTNLRKLLIIIGVMFAALQILRIFEYYFLYVRLDQHHSATAIIAQSGIYERPENSAGAFLVGIALYLVWSKGLMPVGLFRKVWIPTAVILGIFIVTFNPLFSAFSYWIGLTIASLLGAVIVAETMREGSPIFRIFSGRVSRVLGRVSYTVYIWHMFIFILFNRWVSRELKAPIRMLGAWTVLALVSTAAWWIAERPLVRLPPVTASPRLPSPTEQPPGREDPTIDPA